MKLWLAFVAMFKKEFILMRRYFFNAIGGILTLYLVFLLLFLGYRGIGGPAAYGDGIANLVVGYVMWLMMLLAYQVIPHTILGESQEGTLEQLYMSPRGFLILGVFKYISEAVQNMIIVVFMLAVLIATTGESLNIDIITLLPPVLFALIGVCGLGFIFGGITLLFKRIQSYLQIVQFVLIGLVAAPPTLVVFRYLPIVLPSHWVRQVMVRGENLAAIPLADWAIMAGTAAFYLTLGMVFFKWCENLARRRGILGHF